MNVAELKASSLAFRFPGAASSKGGKPHKAKPEEVLHRACFQLVELLQPQYPILEYLFHSPNGGGRSKAEAGALKAMGVRSGVPDLQLPFPSHYFKGLGIELKAGKNTLTNDQRDWLQVASKNGWLVGVARTLEEFDELLKAFLSNKQCRDNKSMPGWNEIFNSK